MSDTNDRVYFKTFPPYPSKRAIYRYQEIPVRAKMQVESLFHARHPVSIVNNSSLNISYVDDKSFSTRDTRSGSRLLERESSARFFIQTLHRYWSAEEKGSPQQQTSRTVSDETIDNQSIDGCIQSIQLGDFVSSKIQRSSINFLYEFGRLLGKETKRHLPRHCHSFESIRGRCMVHI